ncbi:MAG: MMPL family transporter [Lachnospiraceae bacterium]|nr:MMPL family transporter [Lachnospiraceae bacterium]
MSKSGKSKDLNNSFMIRIASFIVDKRLLFFLFYIIAIIFSFFSSNWVKVENDLATYLADDTETRRGLTLMDDQFTTFGTARIMVANIDFQKASELEGSIEGIKGVSSVDFTDKDAKQKDFVKHYNDGSALYTVTFSYDEDDDRSVQALNRVKNLLKNYDYYVSTSLGNQDAEIIQNEMKTIYVLVAIVVVAVLTFTSQSFGEVPVLILTFVAAMILNSGTNFMFGKISFVSNSVSSILQLALSVDYAIIYCNRFKEERRNGYDVRDAAIVSLSKAIPEILSSSLTTISGLFAMVFMRYKIGADMGIVLIKAIMLALLSAFTLMPGLLVLFSGVMEKTQHKNFVPRIDFVGKFAWVTRKVVPIIFLAVVCVSAVLSQKCPYAYSKDSIQAPLENSTQHAQRLIDKTFGKENYVAVVVPGHNYTKEKQFIDALEKRDEVDHVTALANSEAMDGYMITESLNPRQFSEIFDLDYEVCETLYAAYAADNNSYGRIIGGIGSYKVPLMDMIIFLHDTVVGEGYVTLDSDTEKTLDDAYKQISDGRKQLMGDKYDRFLVYLNLPEESTETFNFLDTIHTIASDYYEGGQMKNGVYVVGNSTSERDLRDSFARDNVVVSVVSILFVLVILLFTFKSAGLPVLLVAVIEGAIFMNFAYPAVTHEKIFFLSYLIVSSIQMGANIDYAIVISSRYMELRKTKDRKTTIIESMNFAFPTIITSGSMMVLAGLFISQFTSDSSISGIGECLARGTSISIILVMFALPQILLVGDKIISRTAFDISRPIKTREETGTVLVNGTIRGKVNGTVIGSMNAVVRGDVSAIIVSGSMEKMKDEKAIENKDDEGEFVPSDAEDPPEESSDGSIAAENDREKGDLAEAQSGKEEPSSDRNASEEGRQNSQQSEEHSRREDR